MANLSKKWVLLTTTICLNACTPHISWNIQQEKAAVSLPDHFSGSEDQSTAGKSSAVQQWQMYFTDPTLRQLIETALSNSQELRIMEQEIAIANNEVSARRGEYLPRLGVGASFERERVGEFTSQGVADERNGVAKILNNRQLGFNASWEVDIWHQLRDARKSAQYNYLASIEAKRYAVTQLVAEIATTYYELLALDQQLHIVTDYVAILERGLKIVEWQKEAARANALAVKRFDAEVLKNKSRLYALKQTITVTENRLNALVGRMPQTLTRDSSVFLTITPAPLNLGLPMELLENRPDIKQAMLAMEAAGLNVNVARARFYPALSLDANAGYQAFNTKEFFTRPESVFYVLGVNLTAPVFNRMAIEADFKSASSKQLQTVYQYQKTLLNAYAEVVNQGAAINNMRAIYELKSKQAAVLNQSIGVADSLFKAARIDYLELLLTQRDSLDAQMEQTEAKQQELTAYINLYKALGGGWREVEKTVDESNPSQQSATP